MNVDTRFVFFLVWGVGTLLVFAIVLRRRWRSYKRHHDDRARRDLIEGVALFMVALMSAVAITMVLFGETGTGLRGLAAAVALGAFTASGAVMAIEPDPEP